MKFALKESTGLAPGDPQDRANFERAISEIRTHLGEAKFKQEWDAGRALTLEQAVAEALQVTSQPTNPESQVSTKLPQYPAGLTQREVEVLRLLAMGLTNQEIAKQLVLSKRTVHAHLRSIFAKLDVTTRSAATRVAIEHKIV